MTALMIAGIAPIPIILWLSANGVAIDPAAMSSSVQYYYLLVLIVFGIYHIHRKVGSRTYPRPPAPPGQCDRNDPEASLQDEKIKSLSSELFKLNERVEALEQESRNNDTWRTEQNERH